MDHHFRFNYAALAFLYPRKRAVPQLAAGKCCEDVGYLALRSRPHPPTTAAIGQRTRQHCQGCVAGEATPVWFARGQTRMQVSEDPPAVQTKLP